MAMKKQYRKPEIEIEQYELATSIADSCGSSINDYQAVYEIVKAMNPTMTDQEIVEVMREMYGADVCYHTMQGTSVFFS